MPGDPSRHVTSLCDRARSLSKARKRGYGNPAGMQIFLLGFSGIFVHRRFRRARSLSQSRNVDPLWGALVARLRRPLPERRGWRNERCTDMHSFGRRPARHVPECSIGGAARTCRNVPLAFNAMRRNVRECSGMCGNVQSKREHAKRTYLRVARRRSSDADGRVAKCQGARDEAQNEPNPARPAVGQLGGV